jgi:hypothetical protein
MFLGQAVEELHGDERLPLLDGYTDVVDADLSKNLDTIPHWESVAQRIVDRDMPRLIEMA